MPPDKVIIVEDDPMVTAINGQYLQMNRQFQNGQDAVEKYLDLKKALRPNMQLSQEELDKIIAHRPTQAPPLEKGLQEQTLHLIRSYLSSHPGVLLSSHELAEAVGLSRITIRRYMNYLLENHEITSEIDYSTGGRPSIRYRKL